ncbi:MAG: 50S ribosomal protein L25 [Halanaerobiales bacterium]
MERYNITAEKREETGKGAARRLRRNGKIPAVMYGRSKGAESLIVDPHDISHLLQKNVILDLTIVDDDEEKKETVMIKDYQRDVIKKNLLHVDFQHISMDEKIEVSVPIELTGDSPGVKEGGVLQKLMRMVEISALPSDVPEKISLDLSELELGDSLAVEDLEVGEDVEIISSAEDVIVTVVAPSEEVTEPEEEELEEEFVEPEVIGEEEEEELEEELEKELEEEEE